MKRTFPSSVLLSLFTFVFLSGSSLSHAPQALAQNNKNMKEMYGIMSQLLGDAVNEAAFSAPQSKVRIEKSIKRLSELAHQMKEAPGKLGGLDQDPTIGMISSLFEDETKNAYTHFKRGNRDYARGVIKAVTGYCIACHTRTGSGPSFAELPLTPMLEKASAFEKGEFFAASRQYDKALEQLRSVVSNVDFAQTRQLDWERAVKNSLAIAVRVKKDPDLAIAIVDQAKALPSMALFFRHDLISWQKHLLEWKMEISRTPQSEDGLHAEAVRLMGLARSTARFPLDRSVDMIYLRASVLWHDLLGKFPQGRYKAEALFQLGIAYEAMRDLQVWSLHQLFFESCIRTVPHTDQAQECLKRYEQSIYAGYAGTGGVSIPEDVQAKMISLENLALPTPQLQAEPKK